MTTPSISSLRLLSGPEFMTGTTVLAAINEVTEVSIAMREDGVHECVVTAPVGALWLDSVKARRVIRIASEGVVTEWLINNKADSLGGDTVQVRCDPLQRILADYGIIEYVALAGGMPHANLGGFNGTIENFLETYAIPSLTDRGVSWITTGTIDFTTEQFTLAFEGLTVLGLVAKLAKAAGGVWQLRRDVDHYEIDVLESFGQGTAEVWLSEGRNVLRLERELDREDLRTAIRPIGELPDGEEDRANIVMASHPVIGVSSDTLTIGRHLYEADTTVGPISEDGQFAPVMSAGVTLYAGKYLEAPDGSFHAITTTVSPRTVVVATGGGASFAVGDDVVFVANSSGTGLTELASPDGITDFGFVQGGIELPYHGHRNWAVNPGWRTWGASAPPTALGAFAQGIQASVTSVIIDGLASHAGTVINVGDVFQVTAAAGRSIDAVTTAATIAAGGTVTVPIGTARTVSDNAPCLVHLQSDRSPTYWDRLPASIGKAVPYRTPRVAQSTVSCLANGAHSGDATSGAYVSLDGVATNTVFAPGYMLSRNDNTSRWILSSGTVSTDGVARVVVYEPVSLSDNENCSINAPEIGVASGYVAGQFSGIDTTNFPMLSQDIYVRYIPGISNKLWACADIVARANTGASGWTSSNNKPLLILADSGGTPIVSLAPDDWTPAVGEHRNVVLRVAHEITVSTALKLRFRWGGDSSGSTFPYVWLRFLQLHLGVSETSSLVEGSEATKLFYDGQVVLEAHKQWPAVYSATNVELADAFGLEPTSQLLSLGSTIRLRSTSMGISNTLLRVVGVRFDPLDPRIKDLTLGTQPIYFTDQVGRISRKRLRVQIDVNIDDGGHVIKSTLASEDPEADTPTSSRFYGDPGSITDGAITVETVPDP